MDLPQMAPMSLSTDDGYGEENKSLILHSLLSLYSIMFPNECRQMRAS
jgi:hypothetical protein